MADEVQTSYESGRTLYFFVRDSNGGVWDTTGPSWSSYVGLNRANYVLSMLEQDGGAGWYTGSIPTDIITAGLLTIEIFEQIGVSPDVSDPTIAQGTIPWNGSSAALDVADIWKVEGVAGTLAAAITRVLLSLPAFAPASNNGLLVLGDNTGAVRIRSNGIAALHLDGTAGSAYGLYIQGAATGIANAHGAFIQGGGPTGRGLYVRNSGASSVTDAVKFEAFGSGGHGLLAVGIGTGDGAHFSGGATGDGIHCEGGVTAGHGIHFNATGDLCHGIRATASGNAGFGIEIASSGVSGRGISITTSDGRGVLISSSQEGIVVSSSSNIGMTVSGSSAGVYFSSTSGYGMVLDGGADDLLFSHSDAPSMAAAILDAANGVETGITLRQAQRAIAAGIAGKVTITGSTYAALGNVATTRLVVVDDGGGDRTVTLSL